MDLVITDKLKDNAVVRFFRHHEGRSRRETVRCHLPFNSVDPDFSVLWSSTNREQDRRGPSPPSRVPGPDQFLAFADPASNFGPDQRNLDPVITVLNANLFISN
jgi:hypothetical protein